MNPDGGARARVLVVDDEDAIRQLEMRVLTRAGYSCLAAGDAVEARARMSEAACDLILCDVQMPGESGLDLAEHVSSTYPDTAIVMVSGLDDPATAEAASRVGAYGYMVKPVETNELLIGVANALRRLALEQENRANRGRLEQALVERSAALEQERSLRAKAQHHAEQNALLLESLEERQALLERLSKIQRSISHRAALDDVLDAIVGGAHELLGEEIAALCLIDQDDPSATLLVASRGLSEDELDSARRALVGEGAGGKAIAEEDLIVIDHDHPGGGCAPTAGLETSAAMAAPVRENGALIGSLVVAARRPARVFTAAEQEMLIAFAEHASLALTDAKMLEQMNDALHDSLTGLPNRNLFVERLQTTLAAAAENDTEPAVLLLDLDRFGVVNETLGHDVGDVLLIAVAERLAECITPADTLARFSGDDFAILLNGVESRASPEDVANRIFDSLRTPLDVRGREVAISASIGIASGREQPEQLLRHADIAMYRARRSGKGGYERFSDGMKEGLLQHLQLEADLQRAVEREEFEVHYQPIIALHRRELVGFEALIRWRHPGRGLVPPLAFIPLAEEMGLINAIGHFVLVQACEQARRWEAEFPSDPPLCVNVNVSARQLQRPDFVNEVAKVLRLFELDPTRLVLEITETILMRDAESASGTLIELKKLGVRLAIDDFGTGYSSLHYIRRFPLDILKIAKTFIDGVTRTSEDAALVQTILDLAASFKLDVVAEGIEGLRQHVQLSRLGCQLGQGYHFSHPLNREDTAVLLRRARAGYGRLGASASQDFALPPARQAPARTVAS